MAGEMVILGGGEGKREEDGLVTTGLVWGCRLCQAPAFSRGQAGWMDLLSARTAHGWLHTVRAALYTDSHTKLLLHGPGLSLEDSRDCHWRFETVARVAGFWFGSQLGC